MIWLLVSGSVEGMLRNTCGVIALLSEETYIAFIDNHVQRYCYIHKDPYNVCYDLPSSMRMNVP